MATQEQKSWVARASVTPTKPDGVVCLRGKTSSKTLGDKESTIPPNFRIDINQLVRTLAASPPLAMNEEYPEDAEILRRLQVLAGERS
jgi:hypothetical protein